jgi:AAA+ ATPase superfamily predicted ATPase
MLPELVGREKEKKTLLRALETVESEMVAIIGRRRVGKTFLIRKVYAEHIDLEFTGVQHARREDQLNSFFFILKRYAGNDVELHPPSNWLEAFHQLIIALEAKAQPGRKPVIFFDELPWLATRRSGFLKALGFFWNNWASKNNVVVVICGSAASWMIKKVVQDKGGLHNRITRRITLKPFTLSETARFIEQQGLKLNHYQIVQLYMIMGGIPHYLKELEAGKSAIQNIDEICFSEGGLLTDEFSRLYQALFEHADGHIEVIRALGSKWKGLSRKEILQSTELPNGGGLTNIINELIQSGFVSAYFPFGKKRKEMLYRLTDEYSLFFLHFIEKRRKNESGTWQALSQTSTFKSWSGYAFESLCLKHIDQIKRALQIAGMYSESSSFVFKGNEDLPGIQIDLLIDRNDQVINICEIKFSRQEFTISKAYAEQLRKKMAIFRTVSKTKKQLFLTMITTYGILQNKNSLGLVDHALTMEALFEE